MQNKKLKRQKRYQVPFNGSTSIPTSTKIATNIIVPDLAYALALLPASPIPLRFHQSVRRV